MSSYQNQAVQWLQGNAAVPSADPRWIIYDDAYLGRLTSALSSTLLERLSFLFGESFMQGLLGAFIRAEPPQHPMMPELLRGFPQWLRLAGWAETHPEMVELVELSLGRWDVLNGEDPKNGLASLTSEDSMATLTLQKNHRLFLSALPLYDLWTGDPGEIPLGSQGVLFYKSSPIALECLLIPREHFSFARSISRGLTLFDALQNETDAEKLPELIHHLISTGAFV